MVRVPTDRSPSHPGDILLKEFLEPMGLTQTELANAIGVSYQRINEVVNGKRGITLSTSLRLGKFFNVSSDFWMNLQLRWDLYYVARTEAQSLEKIKVHPAATNNSRE